MKRNKNSERRKKYKLIVKLSEKHSRNRRKNKILARLQLDFKFDAGWLLRACRKSSWREVEIRKDELEHTIDESWAFFSSPLQLVLHCSAFELISRSESMNVRKITTEHCRYLRTAPGRTSRKAHCAVAAELNLNWIITQKLRESSSGTLLTSLNPPKSASYAATSSAARCRKFPRKCATLPIVVLPDLCRRFDTTGGKICIFYETKKEKYPKTIDRYNLI